MAEKPAVRTSDRSQLTRYAFLDERIIAITGANRPQIGNEKSASVR